MFCNDAVTFCSRTQINKWYETKRFDISNALIPSGAFGSRKSLLVSTLYERLSAMQEQVRLPEFR